MTATNLSMPDTPLHLVPNPLEVVHQMQWQESQRALFIADAIASFGFEKRTIGDLDPADAATCRYLGVHALRSSKPQWVKAAMAHAAETCAEALLDFGETSHWSAQKRHAFALILVSRVLPAYLGITEGSIALPPGTYLSIVKGAK